MALFNLGEDLKKVGVGDEIAVWTEKHVFQGTLVDWNWREKVRIKEDRFFGSGGNLTPALITVSWDSIIAVARKPDGGL